MVYDSFQHFYESVVDPMKRANPDHRRLDGRASGGNFDVAGRFRHAGRVWEVHADTHYEPLDLAYGALTGTPARDPFVIGSVRSGERLDLAADLQARRRTRFRHLYMYSYR